MGRQVRRGAASRAGGAGSARRGHARLRLICATWRYYRDANVVVADGADVLPTVTLREEVEAGEGPVEERNKLLRVQPIGEHCGYDDVRVEHRRVIVRVGDRDLNGLE